MRNNTKKRGGTKNGNLIPRKSSPSRSGFKKSKSKLPPLKRKSASNTKPKSPPKNNFNNMPPGPPELKRY